VELFFSASFDPVRIDSNDERMILTVEDRRRPALLVEKEHFTYEHFEMSMEFARTQGRAVELSGMRSGITLAQLEREDVSSALARAGLSDLCDKLTAERILSACREAKNPYAD
jgi:ABC-type thiamine transport system ATPase subunit